MPSKLYSYRQNGPTKQLVVPKAVRETVLKLGHSIPWVGHLEKHKTIARIKHCFYWPGLRKDVVQFVGTVQNTKLHQPNSDNIQSDAFWTSQGSSLPHFSTQ